MNAVLEVTPAEDVTGHAHSIALTAPDGVHFVKGTCREESRWWCDVLSVFLRTKGRHKRATFPGGKATTMLQTPRVSVPTEKSSLSARPRFNSCHTEPVCRVPGVTCSPLSSPLGEVFSPQPSLLSPHSQGYEDQPASSDSPPTRDKLHSECKTRYRRALAREKRAWATDLGTSAMLDADCKSWYLHEVRVSSTINFTWCAAPAAHTARHLLLDDETRRGEKLKDIADCITRPRRPSSLQLQPVRPASTLLLLEPTRDRDCVPELNEEVTASGDKPVRGDPDGCGLDTVSTCFTASGGNASTAELRVDLPAEDLLHLKKGWLLKQGPDKEWGKHWFVLRGSALMFYRDPSAEDNGILDGVIDLGMVRRVADLQVARNYGFEIVPWDEKTVVVSAVTAGIRASWVQALRRAAGLPACSEPPRSAPPMTPTEIPESSHTPATRQRASLGARLERQLESGNLHRPVTRLRPQQQDASQGSLSSDEEYRTASSEASAGAHSEWGDAEDACTVAAPLPSSSPPLNRTPISRVKERARATLLSQRRRTLPNSDTTDFQVERLVGPLLTPSRSAPVSEASTPCSPSSMPTSAQPSPAEIATETRLKALERQLSDALTLLDARDKELQGKDRELSELQQVSQRLANLRTEHAALGQQWRERIASEEQWRISFQKAQSSLESEREEHQQKLLALRREGEDKVQQLTTQVVALQQELDQVQDRLQRGIEENESLCERLRSANMPAANPTAGGLQRRFSRRSLSRVDSLSDLQASFTSLEEAELATWERDRLEEEYLECARRMRVALGEIRATRRELRAAQAEADRIELAAVSARQAALQRQQEHEASAAMLARRVDDLTQKLSTAERQLRQLPPPVGSPQLQKPGQKRRSLSLRGRESMVQVSREVEEKLVELETKVTALQRRSASTEILPTKKPVESPRSAKKLDALCLENKSSPRLQRKGSRRKSDLGPIISSLPHSQSPPPQRAKTLRRKSLDSSPSLELLLRLRLVETKLTQLSGTSEAGVIVNEPELVRSTTSTPTGDRNLEEGSLPKDLLVMVPECYGDEELSGQFLDSSSTSMSQSTEDIARQDPSPALAHTAKILTQKLWVAMGVSRDDGSRDVWVEIREAIEAADTFMTEHRLRLSSQPAILMQMATVSALCSLLRRCLVTRDLTACEELARLVADLGDDLTDSSDKPPPEPCHQCVELVASMDRLCEEHIAEMQAAEFRHNREQAEHHESLQKNQQELIQRHNETEQELRAQIAHLEERLGELDTEYSQQLVGLRASYQRSLEQAARGVEGAQVAAGLDEGVRQRYKAEIQQLRALCEKGLVAMENSHRRIVAELRAEHERQLEQLRVEKDEALAEETQATLAALDAMRKAHEVEVQREIEKFKSQFLEKLKSSPDVRLLHREHEQEMNGIRREILSLSEKYSLKCMQAAQLEEQLATTVHELQQKQQHVSDLEKRNQQLQKHISSPNISEASQSPLSPVSDSILLLQSPARCNKLGGPVTLRSHLAPPPRPLSHQPSLDFQLGVENRTVRGVTSLRGVVAQRKKLFEM
ncbi:hypothetical protein B566_EDAN009632, partial [Ephemera danica]